MIISQAPVQGKSSARASARPASVRCAGVAVFFPAGVTRACLRPIASKSWLAQPDLCDNGGDGGVCVRYPMRSVACGDLFLNARKFAVFGQQPQCNGGSSASAMAACGRCASTFPGFSARRRPSQRSRQAPPPAIFLAFMRICARGGTGAIAAAYIGGATPLPKLIRGASSEPSGCFLAAAMKIFTPVFSSFFSAGW